MTHLQINHNTITNANLNGRGGKERLLESIFTNSLKRESKSLYDSVDTNTHIKYEFKKQKDLQWLDPSKYYNLSIADKKIIMVFICYNDSGIDLIYTCLLGDLVKVEYSNEILEACYKVRQLNAGVQNKKELKTRKFLKENMDICDIIYIK